MHIEYHGKYTPVNITLELYTNRDRVEVSVIGILGVVAVKFVGIYIVFYLNRSAVVWGPRQL